MQKLDEQPHIHPPVRSDGDSRQIGLAGLGLIGTSLAKRLLAAGFNATR